MFKRFLLAALLTLTAFVGVSQAQEIPSVNFYVVPKVGTGTFVDSFRPKYIGEPNVYPEMSPRIAYSAMDYGMDATFLVGANVTQAQATFLATQADVTVIPPLDTAVGGNPVLNQTRNKLEQQSIPGSWITSTTTYRQIVGKIGRFSLVLQVFQGTHHRRLFEPGITLDSNLTAELIVIFTNAAQRFNISPDPLTSAMTVRDALLYLENLMPSFTLAGEVF